MGQGFDLFMIENISLEIKIAMFERFSYKIQDLCRIASVLQEKSSCVHLMNGVG